VRPVDMLVQAVVGMAVLTPGAWAGDGEDFQVQFHIDRRERQLLTSASFHVPLGPCEAYRYLTDYDAAKKITGVLDSRTTRLGGPRVRVERWAEERVLLFTVKLRSVVDYIELPYRGTDFQQVSGDAKVFQGQWRLEPDGDGTWFRFEGLIEPDSAFPMAVVQYFIKHRMRDRIAEMASNGARRRGLEVAACT
jgi:Polyketide cyclase / dehydrase and lipid transport